MNNKNCVKMRRICQNECGQKNDENENLIRDKLDNVFFSLSFLLPLMIKKLKLIYIFSSYTLTACSLTVKLSLDSPHIMLLFNGEGRSKFQLRAEEWIQLTV